MRNNMENEYKDILTSKLLSNDMKADLEDVLRNGDKSTMSLVQGNIRECLEELEKIQKRRERFPFLRDN